MPSRNKTGELEVGNLDIDKFKKIQEDYNRAVNYETEMKAELNMLKKQGAEILKSYGYVSFADISKMKKKLEDMETEIQTTEEEMLDYIKYVNEKKSNKDNIILS